MRRSTGPLGLSVVVALIGFACVSPDLGSESSEVLYRTGSATDVAILSRGGGNGEAEQDTELGCWNLTGAGGYQSSVLLKFGNLSLPVGARVTSASVTMVFANWDDGFVVRGRYVAAPWNPAAPSFGWQNRDNGVQWGTPGARGEGTDLIAGKSFALSGWTGSGADTMVVPLDLEVVQSWVDRPERNQGILLINETANAVTRLYSSRHVRGPVLELNYVVDAAGVDASRPQPPIDAARPDAARADTSPPTAAVTSPAAGASVDGVITVTANASDDTSVVGVRFLVDGIAVANEDVAAPYEVTLDTAPLNSGTHSISARARDAAGNAATSPAVSFTVSHAAPPPTQEVVEATALFRQGLQGYTGTQDASILSRGGGNGEVDRQGTQLGCWQLGGSNGYRNQPLVKFTGLSLPPGARVTSATLRLVFANWTEGFTVRGRYVQAPWNFNSSQLGWAYRDTNLRWAAAGAAGEGTDVIPGKSFELTGWQGRGADAKVIPLDRDVVQSWIDQPATNQGITLINETSNAVTRLYSSRHSIYRPELSITYVTGPAGDGGGGGGSDPSPLTASMTAPSGGAALSGFVNVGVAVSGASSVAGVQFLIDGLPIGREQLATTLSVDTTGLSNAAHTFAARVRDQDGSVATAAAVTAMVSNAPGIDSRASNPTCVAPSRPAVSSTGTLALQALFPNLTIGSGGPFTNESPIVVRRVLMPGNQRLWFVGLRNGRVFQMSDVNASSPPATNLINAQITSRDLSVGEEGFLGMAFDPDIATDPQRNHVYFVKGNWGSVGLYRADVTRNAAGTFVTSNVVQVLSAGAGGHHYGGDVQFGPDGYLYMSVGEDEIYERTRSPNNLRGKVLRIDVHSATPLAGKLYGIPTDNPYRLSSSGQANPACFESGTSQMPDASRPCPEVYARGFRNPFRFTFDRQTGALWLGDVGAEHEEINVVTRNGDYGWNTQEGTTSPNTAITPAVAEIPRGGASCAGNAIIGGFVYRGSAIPWLVGKYLAADNGNGALYALDQPYGRPALSTVRTTACAQFNPASFAEDENGEVYVVALNPGRGLGVFKIVPTSSQPTTSGGPPSLLSATGCFQDGPPDRPVAAAVPYGVNAELWSDGLIKRRWMVLPDNTTITASGDGDWTFPIGTVLLKEFSSASRRIETRLLVRHSDGDWAGYTYVWNAAQTDATLAGDAQQVSLGDGGAAWTIPARADCMGCHTVAKGRSLGPETRQMNLAFTYPNGRRANQLSTLASLGMLSTAYANPRAFTAFVNPRDTTADLGARARAYLHANCSTCHPGPGAKPDFTYDTAFASMRVCNESPTSAVPGGTALIVPGDPSHSVLALRMKNLDGTRMPRLGSARVDAQATALIDTWITGMTGCGGP